MTHVGRGFTPRQAGRKGPPYGYETGSKHPVRATAHGGTR
jgi:hypothetical protein